MRVRAEDAELGAETFDLLTNDMVMDPADSAIGMVALAPVLRHGGLAVMTLKLPYRQPWPSIRRAREVLEREYDVLSIRHLPHNRQEVTALLKRP